MMFTSCLPRVYLRVVHGLDFILDEVQPEINVCPRNQAAFTQTIN